MTELLGIYDYLSICHVRVGKYNGRVTVMITDRPDIHGISITNAFEKVAARVWEEELRPYYPGLKPSEVRWIEHYQAQQFICSESWSEVKLDWSKKEGFYNPVCTPLRDEEVKKGNWEYQ